MSKALSATFLWLLASLSPALAQTPPNLPPYSVWGRNSPVAGPSQAVPFTALQAALGRPSINVSAACNGVTDDTAAFTTAIAAAPSTGATWIVPAGVCLVSAITINKPGILQGQGSGRMTTGTAPTEIKITSATGVILVTANGVGIRDLIVTSSVASGSRTDAGIRLTGAQRLLLTNVGSNGHAYGFWVQQGNIRFQNTFATANALHGYYFDGTSGSGLGEIKLFDTWATSNGSNGFLFEAGAGSGIAGVTMVGPVSDSNTGAGIKFTAAGGNTNADVYITHSEISTNGGHGVDVSSCANCVNLSVVGGLIENAGTQTGIAIGQNVNQFTVGGGVQIHGFATGILADGTGGTLIGAILSGNATADVEFGAHSSGYTCGGLKNTSIFATTPVGVKFTAGAQALSMASCDFSAATAASSGTVPAGSQVSASRGLPPINDGLAAAAEYRFRYANGTLASPSAVTTGQTLSGITQYGYGATGFSAAARAKMEVASLENWTDTAQGAIWQWSVTPVGGTSTRTTMSLNNASLSLGLGGTVSGSVALLGSTSGFSFLSTDATGAITTLNNTLKVVNATAIPAGGTQDAGYLFSSTAHFGMIFGSGVPTASQAQGSLYLRSDGAALTRLYVNTNGTTGYVAIPTVTDLGIYRVVATAVNFNSANTDTAITVPLPPGITRWRINGVFISNANAPISTATAGVFTGAGGTGQTIAATQALTVTATAASTNNNMMALGPTNGSTEAYNDTTIFFRVTTAQGSAATADVIVYINPMS